MLYVGALLTTPAFMVCLVPAVLFNPLWLIVGITGAWLRMAIGGGIYWYHTLENLKAASSYVDELCSKYCISHFQLGELFADVEQKIGPETKFRILIAKPRVGVEPLKKYVTFTFPAFREALVIISKRPEETGLILMALT